MKLLIFRETMSVFLELSSKEVAVKTCAYKESKSKSEVNDFICVLIEVTNENK